jgi:hypothetical protein
MGETGVQTLLKRLQKLDDAFPDAIFSEPQIHRRDPTNPIPVRRSSN